MIKSGIKVTNLKKNKDINYLLVLIIIVSLITYYRVQIQTEIGPMWDTYDFLSNAILFAGQGTGYADLSRPPVLSFLTSIFFRFGYINEVTIFALDGFFVIFGAVGLYLLFKIRFNCMMSFLGSLLFSTFPIIVLFSGIGFSDIPSVSLSIWTFYLAVLAVKINPKYFYLTFLFAILAFLTRYTSGLILFPLLLYLFINYSTFKNLKYIFAGILISFLFLIPILISFYNISGNPFFSFQSFFNGTVNPGAAGNYYYQPDIFYYLNHIFSYIGPAGIAIIIIVLLGVLIYGYFRLDKIKVTYKNILKVNIDKKSIIYILAFFILISIFLFTFSDLFYMISEILFFLFCLTSYKILKNLNIKYLDMDLLFFSWFMAFFIFHSVFVIKDDRYFVTMAPATAYFLTLGFSMISTRINSKFKSKDRILSILSITLIGIMLISTIYYVPEIANQNELIKEKADTAFLASNWLKNYDPDYKSKKIYADFWSYFSWYLRMNVKSMPVFKDGKAYTYQLRDYKIDEESNIAYNNELNQNKADYYFSIRDGLNLTYYKPIKQFKFLILYQRI